MRWIPGIVILGGFLLPLAYFLFSARRNKKKFVRGKSPLSDEEFVNALGLDGITREIAVHVRRYIADHISVPKELLHPGDMMINIKACFWGDWNHDAVYRAIEDFWRGKGKEIRIHPKLMRRLYKVTCSIRNSKFSDYMHAIINEYEGYIEENSEAG